MPPIPLRAADLVKHFGSLTALSTLVILIISALGGSMFPRFPHAGGRASLQPHRVQPGSANV